MITQVQEAITFGKRAVIVAPPGAGKTTIVPLKLLDNPNIKGQIIILEPRRLAARAAASQMAAILNERIGETVGFKIKGLTKVGKQTRIVVMTEGILIRMIQSDPSLSEVGCIIFDEFHERSINSDLGLALSLQLAEILRSDLRIIVMSATLDVGPVLTCWKRKLQLYQTVELIRSTASTYPAQVLKMLGYGKTLPNLSLMRLK